MQFMHRMPVFHKLLSTMMTSQIKSRASSRSFPVGEDHTLTFFFFFSCISDLWREMKDQIYSTGWLHAKNITSLWLVGEMDNNKQKLQMIFYNILPKKTILYAPIYIADWHKKNQNHSFGSDLHCRITCEDSKTFFTFPNCRSKVGRNLQLQIRQVKREEKRKRASYLLLDYSQDTIDKPLHPSPTPDHHYTSNEPSKLSPLPKNKTNAINHQNTQFQLLLLFSPNTLTPLPPTSAPTRTPTHHHHHNNKHSQISTSSPPNSELFWIFLTKTTTTTRDLTHWLQLSGNFLITTTVIFIINNNKIVSRNLQSTIL